MHVNIMELFILKKLKIKYDTGNTFSKEKIKANSLTHKPM